DPMLVQQWPDDPNSPQPDMSSVWWRSDGKTWASLELNFVDANRGDLQQAQTGMSVARGAVYSQLVLSPGGDRRESPQQPSWLATFGRIGWVQPIPKKAAQIRFTLRVKGDLAVGDFNLIAANAAAKSEAAAKAE